MKKNEKNFTLNNGTTIPNIAFGSGREPNCEYAKNMVEQAVHAGFKHFNGSNGYASDSGMAEAINECLSNNIVTRKELFITHKIGGQKMGYNNTLKLFAESSEEYGVDYFDLSMIHSPIDYNPDWKRYVVDTYRAMEKLYREGKVKALGVSNFNIEHLCFLLNYAEIKPMVNEIEVHPYYQQRDLVNLCTQYNIKIAAWSPILHIAENELLMDLGKKYNKSFAQIALKWSIQKGYIPIVSSKINAETTENYDIYDFTLSNEDMDYINSLDGGMYSTDNQRHIINYNAVVSESFYRPVCYKKTFKLFGFLPILKKKKISWAKTKWYFLGIPILKIKTKNR